ncbi:MAG: protein-L-isoaspartate(D-aspartate) O-methyltransferase [Alphaproteobacteria bacterium]
MIIAVRRHFLIAIIAGLISVNGMPAPVSAVSKAYAQNEAGHAEERAELVETVRRSFRSNRGPGVPRTLSKRVAQALGAVPRHEFVPAEVRSHAYRNRPLPIGYGQTISQPTIVALMTELAGIAPGERVLEIGSGSGYQAAVLAEMDAQVHTIEIIPELGKAAADRLSRLGYEKVRTRIGDGYFGWPEAAPFEAIVVTASASHIPPPLTKQLAPGGRMVIPVGPPFTVQQLVLVTKDADGSVKTRQLLPVQFVPLTRGE